MSGYRVERVDPMGWVGVFRKQRGAGKVTANPAFNWAKGRHTKGIIFIYFDSPRYGSYPHRVGIYLTHLTIGIILTPVAIRMNRR